MARYLTEILVIALLSVSSVLAQTTPSPGAVTPTPGSLRILTPKNGDKIAQDFLDFTYELAAPASADSSPTFQVRLDANDPVRTTDMRYTFTALKPGRHTVSVEMLDANNIPVQGSRAEVHFVVAAAAEPQSVPPVERRPTTARMIVASANSGTAPAHLETAALYQEAPAKDNQAQGLPQSSSALPLLSLIGATSLVCGLVSALRLRRR